jgi:5-formyltetrahydrofolate cyclo-ligase
MSLPYDPNAQPRDKPLLRRMLQTERQSMTDRLLRTSQLQEVLRVWLARREDTTVAAYWPIKGEFDPLPALFRWTEGAEGALRDNGRPRIEDGPPRRIGLPVMNRETKQLRFHLWYPGCPMEEDAYNIPKPSGTDMLVPTLMLVPCVGFGPGGVRLGYGGGFYDRTLATLEPRPYTVGLGFAHGFVPWLQAEPHDVPLDAMLTEEGVAWQRPD